MPPPGTSLDPVVAEFLRTKKLAIYVPAYNGARKICEVFDRIPSPIWGR